MASDELSAEVKPPKHLLDTKWVWATVCVFVVGEWAILFYPSLPHWLSFMRQLPPKVSCSDWSKPETAFWNLKAWVIVSLSQAAIWGAVTAASIRCLIGLWRTGEPAGRLRRVVTLVLRGMAFGFGLWFFLTPAPAWDLGCFSQHINVRGAGALGYVAVGAATIVMWVLENRAAKLAATQPGLEVTRKYLEFRKKLQTLLSLSSLVLVFGIIGLITRRSFLEFSPKNFFPQPIALEGFEYTILLGLAYAPVHAAFNSVGAKILDHLAPYPSKGDVTALQDWSRLSSKLGELMQIRLYDWKSFGPVFPILAPFLLGLLSDLVKTASQ